MLIKKILFCFLILALFTPLVIIKTTVFPFVFSKIIFFCLITEICLLIYLFAYYKYPEKFAPRKSWLSLALLIFLFINLIASIFGINFSRSFWSTYERMDGLFILMHFVFFFFILDGLLKSKKNWKIFLSINLFVSSLIAIFALKEFLTNGYRLIVSSTLGNPIYLGTYALVNIFLGIILIYWQLKSKKIMAPFYILGTILNLISLILAYKRGPILGFAIGILFLAIVLIIRNIQKYFKNKSKLNLIYVFIIIFSLILFSYLIRQNAFVQKITISDASSKSRLATWQSAWSAILDRPFLGWGVENFNIAENYHYNPGRLAILENVLFGKIHNKILETGVNSGILGILSYLSIFLIAIVYLFKKNQFITFALTALLISYFVQNIFIFDSPATYLMFFISLVFINWFINQNKNLIIINKKFIKITIILVITCFIILSFWHGIYKPYKANKNFAIALNLSQEEQLRLGLIYEFYNRALNYNTMDNYEAKMRLSQFVIENYNKFNYQDIAPLLNLSQSLLEDEVFKHPRDVLARRFLAYIYNIQSIKNRSYLRFATEQLEEARIISPNNPLVHWQLGINYYKQRNLEKSIKAFKAFLNIHPSPNNKTASLAYLHMGASYDFLGDIDNAILNLKKAVELDAGNTVASDYLKRLTE